MIEASTGPGGTASPQLPGAKPRATGVALLLLLALLLIGAVALVWRTVAAERTERQRFAQSDAILSTLHEINLLTVSAETGQRGYFITLNRDYLAPFLGAKAAYQGSLERLKILLASEGGSKQALGDEIDELTHAKFDELTETIGQIAAGNREAAGLTIVSNRGRALIERQQRALRQLESMERAENFAASAGASRFEDNLIPALVLLTVMIVATLGISLWQVRQIAEVRGRAAAAEKLAQANERINLLAGELNHRVKNLFTVVLAIVRLSARGDAEAKPVVERIVARIDALGRAHDATTRGIESGTLRKLVEIALAPYRSDQLDSSMDGPEVAISDAKGVPFGLLLHELATNAVKYGAWAQPGGIIAVSWRLTDGMVAFEWRETCSGPCTPPDVTRRGFGSMLTDSTVRQLDGDLHRTFEERGLYLRLTFPA